MIAFLGTATLWNIRVSAEVTFGVGNAANCDEVAREISRNWFDVKHIFSEGVGSKRPRSKDFQCISPQYMYNLLPRPIPALSNKLICFKEREIAACCDPQMRACATLWKNWKMWFLVHCGLKWRNKEACIDEAIWRFYWELRSFYRFLYRRPY